MRLLRNGGAENQYLLQTGLAGVGAAAATGSFPTHLVEFQSDFPAFVLQPGQDELRVPLNWSSADGVSLVKTLVFRRGSYRIDVEYALTNGSQAPWSVAPYAQILHDLPPVEKSYFNVDSYSFTGPALYDGTKYDKLKVSDREDASLNRDIKFGWIASLEHHFVVAIAPPQDQTHRYTLKVREKEYVANKESGASISPPMWARPSPWHRAPAVRSRRPCSSDRSCRRSWSPFTRNWAAPPISGC